MHDANALLQRIGAAASTMRRHADEPQTVRRMADEVGAAVRELGGVVRAIAQDSERPAASDGGGLLWIEAPSASRSDAVKWLREQGRDVHSSAPDAALDRIENRQFDCAVMVQGIASSGVTQLLRSIRLADPDLPLLLLATDASRLDLDAVSGVEVKLRPTPMTEILEALPSRSRSEPKAKTAG